MGIEGKITPAGSGSHPSTTRVAWPEGTPGVNAPSRFASEAQPVAAPPALGPRGLPGAPAEQPAADSSVEALRAAAAARAEEAKIRRLERKAALARERAQHEAREKEIQDREERVKAIEGRLQAYKHAPHLALQDLASLGVTPEQLIQAVADGRASPEQLAAAEAAAARQEVARLREDVERQNQERSAAEARGRTQAEREAAASAVNTFKGELRGALARAPGQFPLLERMADRGGIEVAWDHAERLYSEQRRTPEPGEVLAAAEAALQADLDEMTAARAGRGAAPGRGSPAFTPREPSGSAVDRRRWFLEMLDSKLKGLR